MAYIPENPFFSEFSFGYAVTEDLVRAAGAAGSGITIAPVFPSLIEEGKRGFDMMLDRAGIPLFLQFKLAHLLQYKSAGEYKAGHFVPPFYRMQLRCKGPQNQHSLLLQLERDGHEVYYVAPAFHLKKDLDDAYQKREVWNRSFHLRPTAIGDLDSREHHVTFQLPGAWRAYSDTEGQSGETPEPKMWLIRLQDRLKSGKIPPLRSQLETLDQTITRIVLLEEANSLGLPPRTADGALVKVIINLTHIHFRCTLYA